MTAVGVAAVVLDLEPHPSVQDEFGEPVARRPGKRRGGIEPASYLRGVDPEQPDASEPGDVYRVAVEDGADEHRVRTMSGENCQQTHGS
jgi:hypothetical protein